MFLSGALKVAAIMIWPRPPSSETAWAEAQRNKRINRIGSLLFFIPLLTCFVLFLSFNIYWFHAPWEIAYRHHGAAMLRAQIEALPIYNTDRPARFTSYSDDRLIVSVNFPRNEPCAPIFDITSKSLQPTAGPMREWTMILLISTSLYFGTFEGYNIELSVYCDSANPGFNISASDNFPLCFWSCPANTGGRSPPRGQSQHFLSNRPAFWARATI